ncbi:transcription elongation factor GreA [Propionibacteriaceae bacterium Y1685]|uniref:transcription elongation factor GreA n=1 Tax=Microlunatus sp. Y1700 TaxID=3418487 RepID=UPI003B7727C9
MAENTQETVWLTKDAHTKLTAELEHLKTEGRAEIAERIAAARDEGDLKENGGYHAAREEQGQQEARITQLEDLLRRAEVGEAPDNPDEVSPGTEVTIAFDGDESDTETFLLGSREVLGLDDAVDDIQVYSPQSPLGAAILGRTKGDAVSYEAPNGKPINVTIINVKPFTD